MTVKTRIADALNAAEMIRGAGYVHPAEVIEEQHAEIERLLAALLKYGAHLPDCKINSKHDTPCSCGFVMETTDEK